VASLKTADDYFTLKHLTQKKIFQNFQSKTSLCQRRCSAKANVPLGIKITFIIYPKVKDGSWNQPQNIRKF
jgi:hypothetical protein